MVAVTRTRIDSTPLIVRLVAVHTVVLAVVAAVVLGLVAAVVTGSWPAVVLAVLVGCGVGCGVTAWRLRSVDERFASAIGARPISGGSQPRAETVLESVSMAAGIETPRLYEIDSPAVNAITWGFGDGPTHLAVTTGLLSELDRVEMEAVLAHQATAVNDRPIDAITLGACLYGRFASGPLADRVAALVNGSADPRAVVLSDIEGARATRYPPGMTSALEKLTTRTTFVESIPFSCAALCFASPSPEPGPFGVHPPIADRIDLMREW